MKRATAAFMGLGALLAVLSSCHRPVEHIKIGYETNLACAPALLGVAREDFRQRIGIPVRAVAFNSGPGVVDALFRGTVDFGYLDPVAAVSAYVRSRGKFVIVAGTSFGGAALVVSTESAAPGVEGLREQRVATPQSGSEADVEARQFFSGKGFVSREQGGEFQIVPIANLDIARIFLRRDVAASWTVEPWVSELEQVAGGVRLVNQSDIVDPAGLASDPSSVLVVRRTLLEKDPSVVTTFVRVHVALVNDIAADRNGSRALAAAELSRVSGRSFEPAALARAWTRLKFASEIPIRAVTDRAYDAFRIGYMGPEMPDLTPAFSEAPLKAAAGQAPPSRSSL